MRLVFAHTDSLAAKEGKTIKMALRFYLKAVLFPANPSGLTGGEQC